jgi:GR25 family glycosyltransferase involved in LPS biosynthesis
MKKRVDRALLMRYKLDEIGIKYTFIEGIDGNTPENKLLYDTYLKNYNEYKLHNKYTKVPINSYGAYGLLMCYKKLCENIPLNNTENIMIFEDDICFHKDFFSNIEKLDYIHSYDILYLGANQPNWNDTMENELSNGYYNIPYTYYTYGTYGMILKPIIINKIREELDNMLSPFLANIDLLINHILRKYNLKGCVLYPNLVIPQVFESDNATRYHYKEE